MDFNYLYFVIFIPALFYIIFLSIVNKLGKYPVPLPRSENPKKEYIEVVLCTLIVILYLTVDIFVLRTFIDFFYNALVFNSIIFLLIPLIYVYYRDHWTSKDLIITYRVKWKLWIIIKNRWTLEMKNMNLLQK